LEKGEKEFILMPRKLLGEEGVSTKKTTLIHLTVWNANNGHHRHKGGEKKIVSALEKGQKMLGRKRGK